MRKIIAVVGLGAFLALPSAAFAVNGTTSGYGTYGPGPTVPTQSMSNFQRHWNASHESKYYARRSAEWLRRHHGGYDNGY